jgi:hypothetical protein
VGFLAAVAVGSRVWLIKRSLPYHDGECPRGLGLPWAALGAGIYGSPLSDSPSKSLIAAWVGLATGPLLVLPARYLVSQRRLRGLVLVAMPLRPAARIRHQ